MTLIVGVRCSEGVVIGADSAATLGALGQQTVRQDCDKIEVVRDRVLVAVSGPLGLAQRFVGEVARRWAAQKLSGESWEVMGKLRSAFAPHIEEEMRAAQAALPVIGATALTSAVSQTLVALPLKRQAYLFQFDQQGAPEEATVQIPFVCIGSGQRLADPFMAFIRGILWEAGKYPSLADGIFAALWTIQQAIDVAPGGLGGPVHIFTLNPQGGDWRAREIPSDELQEHYQAIDQARAALRDFRKTLQAPAEDVPQPPSPT